MKTVTLLLIVAIFTLFTFCNSSYSADDVKKLYNKAVKAYESKDYTAAINSCEKALEISKKGTKSINKKFNACMGYNIALCHIKNNDYKKAREEIDLVDTNKKIYDLEAYREGSDYMWLFGFYKNEQYDKVPTLNPGLFIDSRFKNDALYIIGDSYYRLKNYKKASEAYAKLKGQYEEEGKYRIASCLFNQKLNVDQVLQEALDQHEDFIEKYSDKGSKFIPATYFNIGAIQLKNKEYADAVKSFNSAIEESKKSPEMYQEMIQKAESNINFITSNVNMDRIIRLVESGDSEFEEGKYIEAAQTYKEIWDDDPLSPQEIRLYAKCREGLSYFKGADNAGSVAAYRQAIENYDQDKYKGTDFANRIQYVENCKLNLALAYQKLEDWTNARKIYEQIPSESKQYELAQLLIAGIYLKEGNLAEAIKKYEMITSNQSISENTRSQAKLHLAYLLCKDKQFAKAADLFSQIASDDAKYHAGYCYYQIGDQKNAINAFKEVLTNYPQSIYTPEAFYAMILAYNNLAEASGISEKKAIYDDAKRDIINFPISLPDKDKQAAVDIIREDIDYTSGNLDDLVNSIISEQRSIIDNPDATADEKERAQMKIAHLLYRKAMLKGESPEYAIPEYQKLLESNSKEIAMYQILACQYQMGLNAESNKNIEEKNKYYKYYKDVISSVNDFLKVININNVEMAIRAYYMLGMAAYQIDKNDIVVEAFGTSDKNDIAIKAFEKVKELESGEDSKYIYDARYRLATLYSDKGQYNAAIPEYKYIIEKNENIGTCMALFNMLRANYGLAHCYNMLGNNGERVAKAGEALEYDRELSGRGCYPEILTTPSQIRAKDNMVFKLRIMKATTPVEIRVIIDDLESSNIALDLRILGCYEVGKFYYESGDYNNSLKYSLKAHEIATNNNTINPISEIEKLEVGGRYSLRDSLHQAALAAPRIIGDNDHWSQTILVLSRFIEYTDNGLFGDIKDDGLKKQLQNVLFSIGSGHQAMGNYIEAVNKFKDLVRRFPGADDEAYWQYEVGNSYYKKQDYATALGEFQKVLDTYPKHEYAVHAMHGMLLCYRDMHNEGDDYYSLLRRLVIEYPQSSYTNECVGLLTNDAGPYYNGKGNDALTAFRANPTQVSQLIEAMKMYRAATDCLKTALLSEHILPMATDANSAISTTINNLRLAVDSVPIPTPPSIRDEATRSLEFVVKTLETLAKKGANVTIRSSARNNLSNFNADSLTIISLRDPTDQAVSSAITRIGAFPNRIAEIERLERDVRGGDSQALTQLERLGNDDPDTDVRNAAMNAINRIRQSLEEIKSETGNAGQNRPDSQAVNVVPNNVVPNNVAPSVTGDDNIPIIIPEALAIKLQLPSLLRREMLLGLISSGNYNLILNGKKPQPLEDMLGMSFTWWYGVQIPQVQSKPDLYIAEAPDMLLPEIAIYDKPKIEIEDISKTDLIWAPSSTELPDRTNDLYKLGRWDVREKWLEPRWKDLGLAAVLTTAAIILNSRPQEEYFSEWPPSSPQFWTGQAIGMPEYKRPPFPSKKMSPEDWREQELSLWYPTPRIQTRLPWYYAQSRNGCFAIGGGLELHAIYKLFKRDVIFP